MTTETVNSASPEQDNHQVIDLLYPHPDQLLRFQEAVKKSTGTVDTYIHPLSTDPQGLFPVTDEYADSLKQAIAESTDPTVMFNEPDQIIPTKDQRNEPIYTILTQRGDSVPRVFGDNSESYENDRKAWKVVTDRFKTAGVKHIRLGGRLLILNKVTKPSGQKILDELKMAAGGKPNASQWLSYNLIPSGCVGGAAQVFLKAGFDVSLSEISLPANKIQPTDLSKHPYFANLY